MSRLFLSVLLLGGTQAWCQSESFTEFLKTDWEYVLENAPEFATYVGDPRYNDRWNDYSIDAVERWKEHDHALMEGLEAFDRDGLSARDRLNYDLFRHNTQIDIDGHAFPGEYLPVNQLGGVQQDIADAVNRMPARTLKHYQDILTRLQSADQPIEDTVKRMQWGLELGITAPAITLRDVPDQIRAQIVDDPTESPIYGPFKNMPEVIAEAEQSRLREDARAAIAQVIVPAYRSMLTFFTNDYLPQARDTIALTALPDGEAWYQWRVRQMTTTNLTPQQIHELGLREVARIRAEMEALIQQIGFEGTFDDFSVFLQTDPQFYFTDKEALLVAYRDIAKRIDPELPKLFGTLPRNPYGVDAIPEYAEKSQTTAYYMPGSPQAGRAGYFSANTYALDTRPKWEMEALTAHEAVPGHHLQISIAQEIEDIPEFRKWGGYTAFVEGWGLYAEKLGEEIGLYDDPYSKYGQLTYEMWRAVRLVVDTGMHSMGWSRQQAIDFFAANSSKQLHDITVEIDRYIVRPGQALAYKLGELKFKELRARAKEELGAAFDVREFHDAVLENGALPLHLVESKIDVWITEKKRTE